MEISSLESPSGGGLSVQLRVWARGGGKRKLLGKGSVSRFRGKLLNQVANRIVSARVQEFAADLSVMAMSVQQCATSLWDDCAKSSRLMLPIEALLVCALRRKH
eukprot:6351708-Amphidinium_carterae.1